MKSTSNACVPLVLILGLSIVFLQPPDACAQADQTSSGGKSIEVFASDAKGSAYEWLEKEQLRSYGPGKPMSRAEFLEHASRMLRSRADRAQGNEVIQEHLSTLVLPTRYEDIAGYVLTEGLAIRVSRAMERRGLVAPSSIAWGTLPTREINAAARRIGSENLVVFNRGLFLFVYDALLTVLRTVETESSSDEEMSLDYSNAAFDRVMDRQLNVPFGFHRLLVAFATGVEPPSITFASDNEYRLLAPLIDCAELFIVGHEYAHVTSNDVAHGVRQLSMTNDKGGWRKVQFNGYEWGQELRADQLGNELALAVENATAPAE